MKTFLRLLIETFKSLVSFILGISVLSIICYLFMFPAVLNTAAFPSEPGKEVLFYILANLYTGLQLLLVATPIWIIAWTRSSVCGKRMENGSIARWRTARTHCLCPFSIKRPEMGTPNRFR